jgi:hypothetical protein
MPYSSSQRYHKSYKKAKPAAKTGKPRLHRKIIHHVTKHHRMRKVKEENLPPWKEKWNNFNETKLGWLEHFVEKAIPWLVMILIFILIGEFTVILEEYGYTLIILSWPWTEIVVPLVHSNASAIEIIDKIIISFFVIDLYFNFFKKRTVLEFLKTSFIDILAIAPIGLLLELSRIGEAQTAIHVAGEVEKEAVKLEREAVEIAKMERSARIAKSIEKLPKVLRLNRLKAFRGKRRLAKI